MIEILNITKSFDKHILFENYNLNVEQGDYVVISGESGCGKTTLLNMIGALESVDSGEIRVDGIDIMQKKNQMNYYRNTVGFLFQNFVLLEEKTVFQNLNIIQEKNRSSNTIEEILRKVELLDRINDKVYTLSGGEQQRVALARLMVKRCTLILADEPTGSLDSRNAELVMSILQKLNEEGTTIILVTHSSELRKRGKRLIAL